MGCTINHRTSTIRYKGRKVLIIENEKNPYEFFIINKYGAIIIYINSKLDKKYKSKILHKAIKNNCR